MLRCYFCRTEVESVEAAIQADWIPSFYDDEREISEPVCPACVSARLQIGDDGEMELAEHTWYAEAAESAQRGNAWPQAAALWQIAAGKCQDADRRAYYAQQSAWCREMQALTNGEET